jgi:hypothetical protein
MERHRRVSPAQIAAEFNVAVVCTNQVTAGAMGGGGGGAGRSQIDMLSLPPPHLQPRTADPGNMFVADAKKPVRGHHVTSLTACRTRCNPPPRPLPSPLACRWAATSWLTWSTRGCVRRMPPNTAPLPTHPPTRSPTHPRAPPGLPAQGQGHAARRQDVRRPLPRGGGHLLHWRARHRGARVIGWLGIGGVVAMTLRRQRAWGVGAGGGGADG